MRFLRAFVLFLITVILFLVAFNFSAAGLWKIPNDPVMTWLKEIKWPPLVTGMTKLKDPTLQRELWGAAAGLVVLVWLMSLMLWRGRGKAIHARTNDGEVVLVHPGALLKFVHHQVKTHPAVVWHKVRIRQKGNRGISIWVMANVRPIDSLPNIRWQIEEAIRNGFSQVLGIEKLDDVTIIIGLDEKTMNTRPGPTGKPEPKPEPPVRGPLETAAAATRWQAPLPGKNAVVNEEVMELPDGGTLSYREPLNDGGTGTDTVENAK